MVAHMNLYIIMKNIYLLLEHNSGILKLLKKVIIYCAKYNT